ncbi:zinc-dependent alcohol dehydrogenase family protein [Gimesia maris]|uniref:Alcohol dehydrogenase D n=1 Tax=Gimesia maris TaxID=122 RepID=A0ABX5YMY4_9PLAN|nr:zinc-dependent alcohol dehydrogenase family protein [Gimesia maris]EDL59412.1 putative zinc-type alcohol dehydrogenase transmembrane protein [Gimesia maris DSM 8797]QEG17033.1 Putative alcohol dehydrogenase D [Gimesia maris]QGQ29847.1 zinc-binding dehydrogenase [Gimesia maris]
MLTRAAVLYEIEKPTPYAESKPLVIEQLSLADPGPGEVLVEMAGAGLCHSDLSTIDGSRPRVMPMVMGHEASGIVREVGPGVHDLQPDDHVVFSFVPLCGHCIPCATGRPALCEPGARANTAGTLLSGRRPFSSNSGQEINHHLGVAAFAEHTVVAQESLIKIDSQLPLSTAALFGCAVMTGVGAVVNTAKIEPGSSVAVFGLGGVGLSTIMGARAAGAETIFAIDLLPAKLERATQVGATHTINASEEDPIQLIKDIQNGVDYTFESVGNELVLQQAYAATRRGGTTITIGLPHPNKMFFVPAVSLVAEERTIKGSYMGSAVPRRDLPRFIAMYQAGLLPVDKLRSSTIQLDEINEAFDALATGTAVRQVITFEK